MKKVFVAFTLVLTQFYGLAFANSDIILQGEELKFNGEINETNVNHFIEIYQASEIKPKTILITSKGGPVKWGLALGNFIFEKHLSVKVTDYCFSSCANYVFPAGTTKFINKDATLGWHGSVQSTDFDMAEIEAFLQTLPADKRQQAKDEIVLSFNRSIEENKIAEIKFYNSIGVNTNVSILGQDKKYSQYTEEQGYRGWDYSIEGMAKLGIKNIVVLGGEWHPKTVHESAKVFRVTVD